MLEFSTSKFKSLGSAALCLGISTGCLANTESAKGQTRIDSRHDSAFVKYQKVNKLLFRGKDVIPDTLSEPPKTNISRPDSVPDREHPKEFTLREACRCKSILLAEYVGVDPPQDQHTYEGRLPMQATYHVCKVLKGRPMEGSLVLHYKIARVNSELHPAHTPKPGSSWILFLDDGKAPLNVTWDTANIVEATAYNLNMTYQVLDAQREQP